jgi:oxygen-dependent protoporphyrinogen oxidase
MARMKRVVIVGGGISGLALAYRLATHAAVTLLESESRPGGKVWTERDGGFVVEHGPNGFLESKPSTLELCRELGLGNELIAASESSRRHRYLLLDGNLQEMPRGPLSLLTTRVLSLGGKLSLVKELLTGGNVPADDESVAAFFRRRWGRNAAEVVGDALVTGIHGGDPELLSLAAAFPRAAEMEAKHGSVIRGFLRSAKERRRAAKARGEPAPQTGRMWSFRDGLRRLIEALAERVRPTCGVDVRRIERADNGWLVRGAGQESWPADAVVLTCPAYRQGEMVADLDAKLAAEVGGIAYNRIAVVALGFRAGEAKAPEGFGYIAPQRTRRDVLGVQWCSAIYPGRAPDGCVLWRALCGGWNRPEVVDWDDAHLLAAVRAELRQALKVEAEPVFHRIVRWERAIPQYHVGHRQRLARVEALAARHAGLFLGGNAYRGVALNDCTEQAGVVASRVVEFLAGSQERPV